MSKVVRINDDDIKRLEKLKKIYIDSVENEKTKKFFESHNLSTWVSIAIKEAIINNE